MPRLDDWSVVTNHTPYRAPELFAAYLHGKLMSPHKDEGLLPGRNVFTSRIVSIDMEEGKAVTKSGTVYMLGTPKEERITPEMSEETLQFLLDCSKKKEEEKEEDAIPSL